MRWSSGLPIGSRVRSLSPGPGMMCGSPTTHSTSGSIMAGRRITATQGLERKRDEELPGLDLPVRSLSALRPPQQLHRDRRPAANLRRGRGCPRPPRQPHRPRRAAPVPHQPRLPPADRRRLVPRQPRLRRTGPLGTSLIHACLRCCRPDLPDVPDVPDAPDASGAPTPATAWWLRRPTPSTRACLVWSSSTAPARRIGRGRAPGACSVTRCASTSAVASP